MLSGGGREEKTENAHAGALSNIGLVSTAVGIKEPCVRLPGGIATGGALGCNTSEVHISFHPSAERPR